MARFFFVVIVCCFFTGIAVAQTAIVDSLRMDIYRAKNEQEELAAILKMCDEYQSIDRDTLDHYAYKAKAMAEKMENNAFRDLAAIAIADDYYRWGWLDSAMAAITPVVNNTNLTLPADRPLYFKAARRQAMYYCSKMKFPEALQVLYKVVGDAEKYNDSLAISSNINTIGSIALLRESPQTALQWFYKGLAFLGRGTAHDAVRAALYVNLSQAHFLSNRLDSAGYYNKEGTRLFRERQVLMGLAIALQRQSRISLKTGDLPAAEAALKEMISVRALMNDGEIYLDDNASLVDFYLATNQVDKAIAYCNKKLARGNLYDAVPGEGQVFNNSLANRMMYYELLAKSYKQKGDTKQYQQMLEEIILAKDTLAEARSEQAIAEMQTKYEVQKKENTIIQQRLTIAQKNNTLLIATGIAFLILMSAFFLFRHYRKKQKLKVEAAIGKEKKLAVKAVADAEEKERKRIAADLHDNLGAYAASIASNLEVLQSDQMTGQHKTALQELNNNSQTMVSQLSDTIWALNKDSLRLTAISDRIKLFLNRIGNSYPDIEMEVKELIEHDVELPPTQAFHLFQIIQEAITNAVKHSATEKIVVTLEGGPQWNVSISDHGRGMKNENHVAGNGLRNMKERASVSGFTIRWEPVDPQGTSVEIEPAGPSPLN